MTTVAYKDGILAADRYNSYGYCKRPTNGKILIGDGVAVGIAGGYPMAREFAHWILAGADPEKRPDKPSDDDYFNALVVYRDPPRLEWWDTWYYPLDLTADGVEAYALGSGREFALGAMHAGLSAVEAVRLAGRYVAGSGFGVVWVDCRAAEGLVVQIAKR